MTRRSRPIAEHEAGHAAMALALGVPVHSAALTPRHAEHTGVCMVTPGLRGNFEDALVCAAGPAADLLAGRNVNWRRRYPYAWASDVDAIRELKFRPREVRALIDLACVLLGDRLAPLHTRVVDALLERDLCEADLQGLLVGEPID